MKNLSPKEPSGVSVDDVMPPKMSHSPLQKFRPYTRDGTQAWKLDLTATSTDRPCQAAIAHG